ncbi:MurR/RpiR family transcriptional regulator [Cytobacillus gottheilii]|uniref:MurR/RpiR family transcriptional regulator n=1 Tax=Cytobacillus gottheilii TaxID=859144 RepID=UPI0009BAF371|nr:MurR/RpiR family transcriptional regulator [Cytobacillus gottheilii]
MVDFTKQQLSKSQQIIADYIQKNIDNVPFMTELDISKACGTSVATVSRFWSAVGFQNLKDFKQYIKSAVNQVTPASKVEASLRKYENGYTPFMLDSALHYLSDTKKHLADQSFQQSIGKIANAENIHLFGAGSSVSLVSLFAFRLKRFNSNVYTFNSSGHEIFEDMIHMKKGDVLFLFGFVQASVEINVLLDYAKKKEICTILMTDMLVSPLLEQATYTLYTSRGDVGEFHSMVAPIALIESIVVNVGKHMGDQALDKLHELHQIRKDYHDRLPRK